MGGGNVSGSRCLSRRSGATWPPRSSTWVFSVMLQAAACDLSPSRSVGPSESVSSVCGHMLGREADSLGYALVDCPAPPTLRSLAECQGLPGRREFACAGEGRVWLELGPEAQSAGRCRLVNRPRPRRTQLAPNASFRMRAVTPSASTVVPGRCPAGETSTRDGRLGIGRGAQPRKIKSMDTSCSLA